MNQRISSLKLFLLFLICCFTFQSKSAEAVSFGDSALTVAVTTVSGAILGASTLPFYEDSGAHTKNIFYGAAIGAVGGVLIAAFAGVQEGQAPDEEDASLNRIYWKTKPLEKTSAIKENRYLDRDLVAWSPIFRYKF